MKQSRIEIRVSREDKERLFQKATGQGLTLSEFLYTRAFKDEVPPSKLNEQKYLALDRLSREINYIGKNINQLLPVLRGIYADRKIEDGEYRELLEELRRYNEKRTVIADGLLSKMFE